MSRLLQLSKVSVQKEPGKSKIKRAQFEGFPDTVRMGVHGGVADYFKLKTRGAVAFDPRLCRGSDRRLYDRDRGWRFWEARGISAAPNKLQVEAEGAHRRSGRQDDFDARFPCGIV